LVEFKQDRGVRRSRHGVMQKLQAFAGELSAAATFLPWAGEARAIRWKPHDRDRFRHDSWRRELAPGHAVRRAAKAMEFVVLVHEYIPSPRRAKF
jgi:hypothetical protein